MAYCQIGLVLDDQHMHTHAMVRAGAIAGISKATYVLATPRCLDWRRDSLRGGGGPGRFARSPRARRRCSPSDRSQRSGRDSQRAAGPEGVVLSWAGLERRGARRVRGAVRCVVRRSGSRLAGRPKVLSYIEDTAQRPPAEFPWHTDLSWLRAPPAFGILNARVVPDQGGDTIWVDLFAVYDALPADEKRRVQQLKLRHRPQPHFFETVRHHHGDEIADRLVAENPPVEHPLVRPYPFDGRPTLFLSPLYADSLVGLSPSQSSSLLASLEQYLDEPRFQFRWQWEQHDLVIWDEASTNHRALGDHYPRYRRMQRCSVQGSAPYFRAVS
jgi:taurine dioxygenase